MQLAGPQTMLSPHITGNPFGLAEPKDAAREVVDIKPITKRGDTEAALAEGRPPGQFWRAVNGEPETENHVAPPSIMQIKISRILQEQASEVIDQPDAIKDPPAEESNPEKDKAAESEPVSQTLPAYEEVVSLGAAKPEEPPQMEELPDPNQGETSEEDD